MSKSIGVSLATLALAAGFLAPTVAAAAEIVGVPTFVGTIEEYVPPGNNGRFAQMRVQFDTASCNGAIVGPRWIIIRSGRMDGVFANHSANFQNAFSLVMTALVSNNEVAISQVNCNLGTQTINLWQSWVGMR